MPVGPNEKPEKPVPLIEKPFKEIDKINKGPQPSDERRIIDDQIGVGGRKREIRPSE